MSLPSDDGRLEQVLAELDSKLTAWSGAISHAQSVVIERLKREPRSTHPSISSDSSPHEEIQIPSTEPISTTPAEPTLSAHAINTGTPLTAEDEAILATLDTDAVLKVQVLRRLSNYTKSVRELVEKYQLGNPEPETGTSMKKSFWRRSSK